MNPPWASRLKFPVSEKFSRLRIDDRIEYDIQDSSKTGYLAHLSFTQDVDKVKSLGWEPITTLDQIYSVDIERFKSERIANE